jgi:hypothetical protein
MLNNLIYRGELGFFIYKIIYKIGRYLKYDHKSDEKYLSELFFKRQGYKLNLNEPKTLNEKIQWLKIHNRAEFHTQMADKYAIREFIKEKIGEEFLVPLVYTTTNYYDVKPENMPDFPFIIKANHDSGSYLIVKDKNKVDWTKLRVDCRWWLSNNYYWFDREWQYKNIKPRIIVEKLLITKAGIIPFDYKINVINGKTEFIYVSVDRENANKRNIYNRNWEPLYFTWANKNKNTQELRGDEIEKPSSMDKMIEIAEEIGKLFPYVRVDFYDVDGKIYFGEITQHHGGGFDQIKPIDFDYKYGELINLKNE